MQRYLYGEEYEEEDGLIEDAEKYERLLIWNSLRRQYLNNEE